MNNQEILQKVGFDVEKASKSMIKNGIINIVIETFFVTLTFVIGVLNHDPAYECEPKLIVWLYVQGGYHASFLLCMIVYLIFGLIKYNLALYKPLIEFFAFLVPCNFYIAWTIYGNFVLFSYSYQCKDYDNGAQIVWWLSFVYLLIAYTMWIGFLIIVVAYAILLLVWMNCIKQEKVKALNRFPYAELFSNRI